MSVADSLSDLARRAAEQSAHIRSEQDTKRILIVPFIRDVLGFDTEDARQVLSEYTADYRNRRLDKVDYAVFANQSAGAAERSPVIVIEAKKVGTQLNASTHDQLAAYFYATDSAPVGIYTNGVQYFFFCDLDTPNKMDTEPFLVIDLDDLKPGSVSDLVNLIEAGFESSRLRNTAERTRNRQRIASTLTDILSDVPDDFVRLVMRRGGGESRTGRRRAEFREDLQRVIADLLQDGSAGPPPEPPRPAEQEQPKEGSVSRQPRQAGEWIALAELMPQAGDPPPAKIRFPDQEIHDVKDWRSLLRAVADWLYGSGRLRVDDAPIKFALYSIINTQPISESGKEMTRPYQIGGQNLYIESHGSGSAMVSRSKALLSHLSVGPAAVHILPRGDV